MATAYAIRAQEVTEASGLSVLSKKLAQRVGYALLVDSQTTGGRQAEQ